MGSCTDFTFYKNVRQVALLTGFLMFLFPGFGSVNVTAFAMQILLVCSL